MLVLQVCRGNAVLSSLACNGYARPAVHNNRCTAGRAIAHTAAIVLYRMVIVNINQLIHRLLIGLLPIMHRPYPEVVIIFDSHAPG
jgi:hypothetical protein